MMKAIILAAGRGKRMLPLTKNCPKCLIKVGGETILEHQLNLLRKNGISEIVIVTGFEAKKIERVGGTKVTYIYNKDYLSTNSLYSLFLAKEYLDSAIILLNSDVLVSQKTMKMLLEENCHNAILVDFNKELEDGEMNVKVSEGNIIEISKDIPAKAASGKSIQTVKISEKCIKQFKSEVIRLIKSGHKDKFPTEAYKPIIENYGLKAIGIKNEWWCEIDTPEDLKRCQNYLDEHRSLQMF